MKCLKIIFAFFLLIFAIGMSQVSYAGFDDFTINVPNGQGGYTAIVIKKSGDGYVGPQGEYYAEFPSVSQLQVMYGLGAPSPVAAPVATPVATYVEPPEVRPVQTYQVIDQPVYTQVEDRADYFVERPQVTEIEERSHPVETDWTFFDFKKKKKSKHENNDNQSATHQAPVENKAHVQPPAQQTPPPQTSSPPKDDNKDHPKKHKDDSK